MVEGLRATLGMDQAQQRYHAEVTEVHQCMMQRILDHTQREEVYKVFLGQVVNIQGGVTNHFTKVLT